MKAIFIAYNQAYNEEIIDLLAANGQRGFTKWEEIPGQGGVDGEPHLGNHAWPVQNHALLTVVADDKVDPIMADIKATDEKYPDLGLRAYSWNIEKAY